MKKIYFLLLTSIVFLSGSEDEFKMDISTEVETESFDIDPFDSFKKLFLSEQSALRSGDYTVELESFNEMLSAFYNKNITTNDYHVLENLQKILAHLKTLLKSIYVQNLPHSNQKLLFLQTSLLIDQLDEIINKYENSYDKYHKLILFLAENLKKTAQIIEKQA